MKLELKPVTRLTGLLTIASYHAVWPPSRVPLRFLKEVHTVAKNRKYPESRFHSPNVIDVQEDDEQKPIAVKLKGANLRIVSVDQRWEEEEPEAEWRDGPMTIRHYLVTLEDGQQITIIRNMTYKRWYY